jgi:hypothetical protein
MIFVNPDSVIASPARRASLAALTTNLKNLPVAARAAYVNDHRADSWAHPEVLAALRAVIGNKCWYTEVFLEGADPNVDHFRPKGRVREVDEELNATGLQSDGYWWLAFELLNFRLASMHANQRRVDSDTDGGKWDFFPVRGARAPEGTVWGAIIEDVLPLDPCSKSDVSRLCFDMEGKPCALTVATPTDTLRVKATIWLYHLNKSELQARRTAHVQEVQKDLRKAHVEHILWAPTSAAPNLQAKASFDGKLAEIATKISDTSEFAGAKRWAVRAAISEYPWIEGYDLI